MQFDFDACRDVLYQGLLDALAENADRLRELGKTGTIDGVSYDLLPWHQFVALSFRAPTDRCVTADGRELDIRYSPADWANYEFIGDGSFDAVRKFTGELYPMSGGTPGQETLHLMLLAAAHALLDEHIGSQLTNFGFDAVIETDKVQWGNFEYIVLDEDKAFRANYCEILIANRLASRLLGRTV